MSFSAENATHTKENDDGKRQYKVIMNTCDFPDASAAETKKEQLKNGEDMTMAEIGMCPSK